MLCTGTEHLEDEVWEVMKPSDFFEFAIPFQMSGDTKVDNARFQEVFASMLYILSWPKNDPLY